jgi:hypothetical protein
LGRPIDGEGVFDLGSALVIRLACGANAMQINIPQNVEGYVLGKAAAAGFTDVNAYVIGLIEKDRGSKSPAPIDSTLEELRNLRAEVPKMTAEEIVQLVAEGRERCPQ